MGAEGEFRVFSVETVFCDIDFTAAPAWCVFTRTLGDSLNAAAARSCDLIHHIHVL